MEQRLLPLTESAPDHARLALQPREVRFSDLLPFPGRHSLDSSKSERRGFRPTPQKVLLHAVKANKTSSGDGLEAESGGEEEEKRRGRQRMHDGKPFKSKATKALPKLPPHSEQITDRMEISGNAVRVEDYGFSALNALAVLGNCVARERQMKEELARIHAAKMSAFRGVINLYLSSVKGSVMVSGRRKAASKLALAQCAVVVQTLVVTIQSYMRAFQSRATTAVRRSLWRSGLDIDAGSSLSVRMPQFKGRSGSEPSALSETTSSLHELLDEVEINRLKQLYFDYYDCDVYLIPGTIPECDMPSNAQMLTSLSANDPFLPDDDDLVRRSSLLTTSTSSTDVPLSSHSNMENLYMTKEKRKEKK